MFGPKLRSSDLESHVPWGSASRRINSIGPVASGSRAPSPVLQDGGRVLWSATNPRRARRVGIGEREVCSSTFVTDLSVGFAELPREVRAKGLDLKSGAKGGRMGARREKVKRRKRRTRNAQ